MQSRPSPHPLRGVKVLLGCVWVFTLVACGSSTPAPPHFPETCLADKPELRLWARDIIAVALQLPNEAHPNDAILAADVQNKIDIYVQKMGVQLTVLPPMLSMGLNATVFYHLDENNRPDASKDSTGCDTQLISVVDTLNSNLGVSSGNTVTGIVVKDVAQQPVATIMGVSPDWVVNVRDGGDGDHVGPSGPASLPPSTFQLTDVQDMVAPMVAPAPDAGKGTTVVVLDTGYSPGTPTGSGVGALHMRTCGDASSAVCLPAFQPIGTLNPALNRGLGQLPPAFAELATQIQEADLQSPFDQAPDTLANGPAHASPPVGVKAVYPPYELSDASDHPINIVDHGLFVSGLIHEAAPAAQIDLVRIVNDYGVGDLRTLLLALQAIYNYPTQLPGGTQHVVLNLSLSIGPPLDCMLGLWKQWKTIQLNEDAELQAQTHAGQTPDPRRWVAYFATHPALCSLVSSDSIEAGRALTSSVTPDVGLYMAIALALQAFGSATPRPVVVAASGNEGMSFDADLPAALCSVVAVQAVSAGGGSASFSNQPFLSPNQHCLDVQPRQSGVGAGQVVVTMPANRPSVSAVGVQVCGVYLQPIPSTSATAPASSSLIHFAFWNGTSFATALASGAIARLGTLPTGTPFMIPDTQPCNQL